MQKLYLSPTQISPEILFSPEENLFLIRGTSSPEDVRAMYYPIIEWTRSFVNELLEVESVIYLPDSPLKFQVNLDYFNSSSAKFLFDIFAELKKVTQKEIPVIIEWIYDAEDLDMKEAGTDIALLLEMEFSFKTKTGKT